MTNKAVHIPAITVVGDREIVRILDQEAAVSYPTLACRYDGFVDDVFSEYTNPSIVRPRSVREAQIRSELSAMFNRGDNDPEQESAVWRSAHPTLTERVRQQWNQFRHLPEPGEYYLGWTAYHTAGAAEDLTVWLGAQEVAHVPSRGDNRVHLVVLEEPFYIDFGERLRLVTEANDAPYRLERIVLLRSLPAPESSELRISDISADLEGQTARLNWRTSRPARCTVRYRGAGGTGQAVEDPEPLANHSLALPGVAAPELRFEISVQDEDGAGAYSGELALADLLPLRGDQRQSGRVPFTVVNRLGRAAHAWPVTWGLPFARGALQDLGRCRLVGADGQVLPCQKRVQVSWDDGSVRWALFDFQIDLDPGGSTALAVEYGPQVHDGVPEKGIVSRWTPDGLVVDAGRLRLAFRREGYAFPAEIELRTEDGWQRVTSPSGALSAIELVDGEGMRYEVRELDEIELEEPGPLRATVRLVARHRASDGSALFRSILRVSAYLGHPTLRVQHTFENDAVEPLFSHIRSLRLGANLEPSWLERAWDGDGTYALQDGPIHLLQPTADAFQVSHGEAVRGSGDRASPWWAAGGQGGTAAVAMRDFWQNYPKGWEVGPGGMWVEVCPDVSDISYASEDDLEVVRTTFYLQEGGYKLKHGMARTHDLLLAFGSDVDALQPTLQLFCTPPLTRVEPQLLERTGVLSAICPRGLPGGEGYDHWCDDALAIYQADREAKQAYGMLNFGDWYGERRYNWGDMEYDTPYGFLLEYLRGGSDRWFDLGWQAAWHLADVDTCHHHLNPSRAGRQYLHSLGHVGDYYPEGYLPTAMGGEHVSWTHTWVEGLFLYALMTGERRLWEVASRTVETLAGADLNCYDFTNCRDCGWPLRHLIGTYQATGRKQFLNGAAIVVERVLERQRSSGGWERLMIPGHCFHVPPRHMGNAGFMVGILLAAMKRYHEETGDTEVGQAIVDAAHYLIESMWEPQRNAFRYTSCPGSTVSGLNTQILEGIGYAWRLSGDEALKQTLLDGLPGCLTTPSTRPGSAVGKDISTRMRSMPFIMEAVVRSSGESGS